MTQHHVGDWLFGHAPLSKRINVRETLRGLSRDPLAGFLEAIGAETRVIVVQSDASRYMETYQNYYLSLRRFLPAMSVAARWSRGPYYKVKYGGKYTPAERRLADAFNNVAPYLYLDFYNCLLWGRILLDRVTALARHFLTEPDRPSFTSFADHKKFFLKRQTPYGEHEAYAKYMREKTAWFEMPLKTVRDHYVVHSSPKHQRFFGYPGGNHELQLILITPAGDDPEKAFARVREITVGIPQMAAEIQTFLAWFARYGTRASARKIRRAAG